MTQDADEFPSSPPAGEEPPMGAVPGPGDEDVAIPADPAIAADVLSDDEEAIAAAEQQTAADETGSGTRSGR